MQGSFRQRVKPFGHVHAWAEHEERVASEPVGRRLARQLAKRSSDPVLPGLTGIQDQRRQLFRRAPVLEQGGDARLPPARGKPQDDGLPSGREPKTEGGGKTFDGERDAAHDRGRQLDDETGHRLEIDAGPLEAIRDCAAIREGVRIPWKEDRDLLAVSGELDHLVDRFERRDVGMRGGEVQQTSAASIAIANDIGVLDRLDCLHGGKTWMTWSDADQPDRAHATTPIPTRDMADRLELSADHVIR